MFEGKDTRPAVPSHGGALTFNDLDSLQRLTKYLAASQMMPKQYNTPEKIGTGIQFAVQLGFRDKWLLAIRQIAVINGTPSVFGDLPLALVRQSGLLSHFEEFLIDKNGLRICLANKNLASEFFAAVCIAKRKEHSGAQFESEVVFSVEDAKRAGIWGVNVWKVYPKRMIQMRARSIALKDMFPDVLNGMAIAEYDFNTTIDKVEPTAEDPAAKLNAILADPIAIAEIVEAVAPSGEFTSDGPQRMVIADPNFPKETKPTALEDFEAFTPTPIGAVE